MADGGYPEPRATLREFRALYTEHYGFVWAVIARFGIDAAHIDDAVQDTFVIAHRRFDHGVRSPRAWLYGIARRVASNHRRSAARTRRKATALHGAHGDRGASPDRETVIAIDEFLAGLADGDRELFVLWEIEGMSGPEVAQALGVQLDAVYGRIQILRRRFQAQVVAAPGACTAILRRRRPRATHRGWLALAFQLGGPPLAWSAAIGSVVVRATWIVPLAITAAIGGSQLADAPQRMRARAFEVPTREIVEPTRIALTAAALPSFVTPSIAVPSSVSPRARHRADTRARAPDSLARELAILAEADAELAAGHPDTALARLGGHAREFPNSALADVRAAVRIDALCRAGARAQARGEAAVATRSHRGSVVLARIARSCAREPPETPRAGHEDQR